MRILFLYTKIDNALKEKIAQLEAHNAEVSTLSLLEYKLEENGETFYQEPQSKLEFLEKNSGKLRVLNRIFKRKKLLDKLEDYDIIDVYKCEKSALFIVDEIREKCYDYFVTVSQHDEEPNLINKQFYKYLYDKARFLIFDSKALLEDFPYEVEEKARLIYTPIPMLLELDDISEEEIFKASYAMGFDLDKDIIYCDMSGTLQTQLQFIDDLLQLPTERLRQSTFIFHLNAHSLDERTKIKAHMQDKNFDYLLIETLITPKQSALLYKIADKSIILSDSKQTDALPLSLYAKNHTYLYGDIMIDPLYHDKEFFLDTFTNFRNENADENLIINDMIKSNHDKIALYFSPEESINRYIEVIKEV